MLKDEDIVFSGDIYPCNCTGYVWVIDGECLYDIPLKNEYEDMFVTAIPIDVSNEYPDWHGITIRFIKDGNIIEDFQTTEYFGSILLSNPQMIRLQDYPYGRYVQSPYATFDGEKFNILNFDTTYLQPWYKEEGNNV